MVRLAGIGSIYSLTGNADHGEQRPLSPAQQPQKMLAIVASDRHCGLWSTELKDVGNAV